MNPKRGGSALLKGLLRVQARMSGPACAPRARALKACAPSRGVASRAANGARHPRSAVLTSGGTRSRAEGATTHGNVKKTALTAMIHEADEEFFVFVKKREGMVRTSLPEIQRHSATFSELSVALRERRQHHSEAGLRVLAEWQRQRLQSTSRGSDGSELRREAWRAVWASARGTAKLPAGTALKRSVGLLVLVALLVCGGAAWAFAPT